MKVATAATSVVSSAGVASTKGYTIRANAHSFRALSSGLYSDKIAAVLREIGCNAHDAHVAAGTPDRPFEVKLPNRLDPQFYIKDWGPGLSHDDVISLYSTYFESTKQTSNAFTGAFGLGSKSPFSYTDSYTVTSTHGGKKRTYSAHIGDEGVPTIALLTEEDAEPGWPSGLMVGFPVPPHDYDYFANKAEDIFSWFTTTPTIIGAKQTIKRKVLTKGQLYSTVENLGGLHVLMGNVLYPVELDKINSSKVRASISLLKQQNGVVFNMPIGDVQPAMSREGLQYDPDTMKALEARILGAVSEMLTTAKTMLSQTGLPWPKTCALGVDVITALGLASSSTYHVAEALDEIGETALADKLRTIKTNYLSLDAKPFGISTLDAVNIRVMTVNYRGKVHEGTGLYNELTPVPRTVIHVPMDANLRIVYGACVAAVKRAKILATTALPQSRVMLILPGTKLDTNAKIQKMVSDLKAALNIDSSQVIDSSTLLRPPVKARTKSGTKILAAQPFPATAKIQSRSLVQMSKHSGGANVQPPNTSDKVPYLVRPPHWASFRKYKDTIAKDEWLDAYHVQWLAERTESLRTLLGLPDRHVYFPTADEARAYQIKLRPNWIHFDDWLREFLQSKNVLDEVKSAALKWRPWIHIHQGSTSWVGSLIWMRHANKQAYEDAVEPGLKLAGLDTLFQDLYAESSKAGNKGTRKDVPDVLFVYDELAHKLNLPPVGMAGNARSYTTPEDLERQLLSKFPLLDVVQPQSLISAIEKSQAHATTLTKTLFS